MWCNMSCASRSEGHGPARSAGCAVRRMSTAPLRSRGMILRSKSMAQGARVPWEHEAQFESDISNRGVFNQLERRPKPIPWRLPVQIRSPLLCQKDILRKERRTMRSTVLTREMNQIKKNIQFWFCIQKNWILFDVLVRLRG